MNSHTIIGKVKIRRLFNLIVVVVFVGLLALPTTSVQADVTFTVNTTADASDDNLVDGWCRTDAEQCSLRAAIEQAASISTSSNPVTIEFSSGISGGTISLTIGPLILDASYVTIDGGSKNMKISGASLGPAQSILQIQGDSNTVRYLTFRDSKWDGVQMGHFGFPGVGNSNTLNNVKIFNSFQSGVFIHGTSSGGDDNTVSVSVIGASSLSDTTCTAPNGNGANGIYIDGAADNTLITSNRIVCSVNDGVNLDGSAGAATNTTIKSNYIGTFGSSAMSNSSNGIFDNSSSGTLIWGNIISGNSLYGVWLFGSTGASFWNNKIGTDADGDAALPNGLGGVVIQNASSNITIGHPTNSNYGNVISGNTNGNGISIQDSHDVVLDGNYIGLGADGTTVIPNGFTAVDIIGSSWITLSSSDATVKQFISGNSREGVSSNNSNHVYIYNETNIGVAADLTTSRGNGLEGIWLHDGTTNSGIYPGMLAYNGLAGVAVSGNTSLGNRIGPNIVRNNGGLAIDLGIDGFTANGTNPPPGPNNWMEYPEVDVIRSYGIDGHTCPGCFVDFYQAIGDPTSNGGGGIFLAWVGANAVTGAFSYDFPPTVSTVSMIATDETVNGSSEMSPTVSRKATNLVFLPIVQK